MDGHKLRSEDVGALTGCLALSISAVFFLTRLISALYFIYLDFMPADLTIQYLLFFAIHALVLGLGITAIRLGSGLWRIAGLLSVACSIAVG